METKQVLDIPTQYQNWRRDAHIPNKYPMPDPKELGEAIDCAIKVLSDSTKGKEQEENKDQFVTILNSLYATYKAKNHDYGNSFADLYKDLGMTYAYGHMAEKLSRVRSLIRQEAQVKAESITDSLLDLANYAILTIIEIQKKQKQK